MIPEPYSWIANEPGPRMIVEARRLYGIQETAGPGNTPAIMEWVHELGPDVAKVFTNDAVPWCGLFISIVAQRAGKNLPHSPLWAKSWATWGDNSPTPKLGDVLVFTRMGGGHVGLYVGENASNYFVLGGNQSDGVNIKTKPKYSCIASRNSYKLGPPSNVRSIFINGNGDPSTKET